VQGPAACCEAIQCPLACMPEDNIRMSWHGGEGSRQHEQAHDGSQATEQG
jgi:hypothetical protein